MGKLRNEVTVKHDCAGIVTMSNNVRDNAERHRFELDADGHVAFSNYRRDGRTIVIMHTEVPKELNGRGIGSALTRMLLDDARAAGITEISALASGDNPAALALIRRSACILEVRLEGPEQAIRAAIA